MTAWQDSPRSICRPVRARSGANRPMQAIALINVPKQMIRYYLRDHWHCQDRKNLMDWTIQEDCDWEGRGWTVFPPMIRRTRVPRHVSPFFPTSRQSPNNQVLTGFPGCPRAGPRAGQSRYLVCLHASPLALPARRLYTQPVPILRNRFPARNMRKRDAVQ